MSLEASPLKTCLMERKPLRTQMKPKKSLGQHFLKCKWVISTLINAGEVGPEDVILEIGPGKGILTRGLAKKAKKVIAVEKDERLAHELKNAIQKEGITNAHLIIGDILHLYLTEYGTNSFMEQKYKIVANIPYYLTSRLLRLLLEAEQKPAIIALTIQKEVAQRIMAKPPHMNLLALSVQAYGTPEIIKTVPANCFYPKPKVDSAIIKISDISDKFFKKHKIGDRKFFEIIRKSFGQKRKMLLRSLASYIARPKLEKILVGLGLKTTARPEELTLEQWTTLISFMEK